MSKPYQPIPDKTQLRADALIGQRVDGYEVVERLGEGGMGAVYRAQSAGGENQVALKILKPELVSTEQIAKQIFEEARAVSSIGAPGIVSVLAQGRLSDGRYYLVTEFLQGEPLDWALRNKGKLALHEVAEILDEVATALEAAHAWGIVHGNLKPSNVFLVAQPQGRPTVKLLDFGLAKQGFVSGRRVPGTDQVEVVGTPEFMAPEQARAEPVVPQTDLYALGALAFWLLTGRTVFVGKSASEVVTQHVSGFPPRPSSLNDDVPESLDRLVLDLLQKNPENRPSVTEVRVALFGLKRQLGAAEAQTTQLMSAGPLATQAVAADALRTQQVSAITQGSAVKPRPVRIGFVVAALGALALAALAVTLLAWPDGSEPPVDAPRVERPPSRPPPPSPPPPVQPPRPVETAAPVEVRERPAPRPPVDRAPDAPRAVPRPASKAAPSEAAINERISRIDARLRKAKDPDLEKDGMRKLSMQRMRMTGSPSADERRDIAHELDVIEHVYLLR